MRSRTKTPSSSDPGTSAIDSSTFVDEDTLDFLDDEQIEALADDTEVATISSDPLDVEASDPPGADTEGLDAAPSEIPTRVGAGSSGDLTGMSADEAVATDEDGADGSDIAIDDGEEDPDRPKDLIDLMVESVGGGVDASKI
jgi:hypothetical protein